MDVGGEQPGTLPVTIDVVPAGLNPTSLSWSAGLYLDLRFHPDSFPGAVKLRAGV